VGSLSEEACGSEMKNYSMFRRVVFLVYKAQDDREPEKRFHRRRQVSSGHGAPCYGT